MRSATKDKATPETTPKAAEMRPIEPTSNIAWRMEEPEGHADTEFACALRNEVRNQPIDSDRRKQECQSRYHSEGATSAL